MIRSTRLTRLTRLTRTTRRHPPTPHHPRPTTEEFAMPLFAATHTTERDTLLEWIDDALVNARS
ncbi:MAG: hypothetical protein V7768_12895, partial [Dietzia cercidiphylli]